MTHELKELISSLQQRDENMVNDINMSGGMTVDARIALADARACDALAAITILCKYIMDKESVAPSPDAAGCHEQRLIDLLKEVSQGCLDHANESDNPIKGEWLHAECVIRNVLEEFNRG